ncbi:Muscle M-line assembly protein unc-89 [Aphelenchoides besseyi]|nr:Muscle M-line assembly protein unc-89 [Aphelenchoides besseyi]
MATVDVASLNDERPTTTTISTIAVRAEPHTTIVIAMLKSLGDIELRIDEMKPRLLEIGANGEETTKLLDSHSDLITRLASKQEQVEELLTRADQLVTEQKDQDIYVYSAMADSLGIAWKELNRQLELRGYILEDTLCFYEHTDKQEQQLDDVFELLQSRDRTVALNAFDVFCRFPDELLTDFLRRDDFERVKTIVKIFANISMVNVGILETMIVVAQTERGAELVAQNEKVVKKLFSLAKSGDPLKFVLPLTQTSRMAPKALHEMLFRLNGNYFTLLEETFNACNGGETQPQRLIHVSYVFLNVTQNRDACEQLFTEKIEVLSSFLTNTSAVVPFKIIVAKILLNIAGHIDLHHLLTNEQTLADIVDPFADEDDQISSEEMDKLPLQLQYVDHKRSASTHLLNSLIELMAQLCTSKLGRERMRSSGMYVILREFDKSRRDKTIPLVEERFMTLDGTPEWNLLMNTLLFDDRELNVENDLREESASCGITEFNLDSLAAELEALEQENENAEKNKKQEAETSGSRESLTQKTHHLLKEMIQKHGSPQTVQQVQIVVDELIDTTANAVDLGSTIITQIRILGALADNTQRPAEVVEACLLIEKAMLRMSTEWQMVETLWSEEKSKMRKVTTTPVIMPKEPVKKLDANKLGTQLNAIEAWLQSARKRFQKNVTSASLILSEANKQQLALERLATEISQNAPQSPLDIKAGQLEQMLVKFIAELQEGGKPDERIGQFLQNADSILNQLDQMGWDLQNATAAVAGELRPLARQKVSNVTDEGVQILRQIGPNQQIEEKLSVLRSKLAEIEKLAKQRAEGNSHLLNQVQELILWVRDKAETFLANNGNLGADNNTVQEFLQAHWGFATDLLNKESSVNSILNKTHELNEDGKKQVQDLYNRYENVKQILEKRIQMGNTFKQANKFGTDLDKSLHSILTLLNDNQRNFMDESVSKQINSLFYVIQSSLAQEKHQAEKFLLTVKSANTNDLHLNSDQALDIITSSLAAHEQKFDELQNKWSEWQQNKTRIHNASQTVEEIQMWQIDTIEYLSLLEQKVQKPVETIEDRENLRQEIVREVRELPVVRQTQRLDDAYRVFKEQQQNPETIRRIESAKQQQQQIAQRVHQLNEAAQRIVKDTVTEEHNLTITKMSNQAQQPIEDKPHFARPLQNLSINEGQQARLECEIKAVPDCQVIWYREEEVIRESERIRLEYMGDRCVLTIDNVEPKDSGLYKKQNSTSQKRRTVKAQNMHGETTNFSRLQVNPRKHADSSRVQSTVHEPPNFNPSLMNQVICEGESAVIEVRVTGKPQPYLKWTKDDQPLQQSANVHLVTEENGWSRIYIQHVGPEDIGLYVVKAVNPSGEGRTGATLNMIPQNFGQQQVIQQNSRTTQFTRGATAPLEHTIPIRQERESVYSDGGHQNSTQGHQLHRTSTVTGASVYDATSATTRFPVIDDISDFGFSSLANGPQFIRPFPTEFTTTEDERKVTIDCLMVANPRPRVTWFFNDRPIQSNWQFAEFSNVGDTYSISFSPAKLQVSNAGTYRMCAENVKGKAESSVLVHVRPKSMMPAPVRRTPHRVVQGFGGSDYGVKQIVYESNRGTPPPAKRSVPVYTDQQPNDQPPHFLQTLTSQVAIAGDSARFDAVVTGLPAPQVEFSIDGEKISPETHPYIRFIKDNGRVGLIFTNVMPEMSGKIMASATNKAGIATSSAQFVVRPRTTAPDFAQRLISEEVAVGDTLQWSVKVTGAPEPEVHWMRNGQKIPNCEEVQLINSGNGVHTLLIPKVELADGGTFSAIASNISGEARSTADLVVRASGQERGSYFHITKVTQEKNVNGEEVTRNQSFSIESPRNTPAR